MDSKKITPENITKPIQLLGAWLVGLLAIDGAFLTAATSMELSSWQSGALTVAAILNVPIFIGALFLLQTKFRPELQEDSYYSTYLNNRTNEVMTLPSKDVQFEQLTSKIQHLENKLKNVSEDSDEINLSSLKYAVNVHLENQDEIETELDALNIPMIRMFGEGIDKPDVLKVAIAEHLPKKLINEILAMAKRLGIDHFTYIEPWENIEEDVMFGAYGETEGKISLKAA